MPSKYFILPLILLPLILITACKQNETTPDNIDYRQEMRDFVINLAAYARSYDNDFLIVPQNGQELITDIENGDVQKDYLDAINGTGREDMFYGYNKDDEETPFEDRQYLLDMCLLYEQYDKEVFATDYCSTQSKVDNSYQLNNENGFISFAADERDLNNIPAYPASPYDENNNDVTLLSEAKNFLYLINSENFETKQDFINAISGTSYDMVIMDLFYNDTIYSYAEIEQLKTKQNGGTRLVLCYMSIGEAEDYRYYWQADWYTHKPAWLGDENPDWEGNYKVRYWEPGWQEIILGNDNSYLKKIIDAGFDGAYLDIIDAFEYYE
jgi:cysteinyl-tRNA synthetase, unknown class